MTLEFVGRTMDLEKGYWTVFPDLCKGCGLCIEKCPVDCIDWSDVLGAYGTPSVKADNRCIACGICQNICPDCALRLDKKKTKEH